MFRMLVAQIKAGGTVSDDVRSGEWNPDSYLY